MTNPRLSDIDASLYFITDTTMCEQAGRTVAQTVELAVAGGAGIVQVRDKHATDDTFATLTLSVLEAVENARSAHNITRPVPVFVNDRVNVAASLINDGHDIHVHVGQDDTSVPRVRELIGKTPLIGLSANTPEDIEAARAHGDFGNGGVDLLGVGPVWDTATKEGAPAGLGVDTLKNLTAASAIPVFAIGGINAERAAQLKDTSVAGVCVVSEICCATDPQVQAREIYDAFRN